MKVMVAGGNGFLGQYVVSELTRRGHRVVVLSRGTRQPVYAEDVEWIACDVAAGDLPLDRMRDCGALVNLIGIKREVASQTFARVHVEATKHLIDAARKARLRRIVHISVVAARPDPGSGYHDTKWQAEELVRKSGLDFTILKPGVIYGRGDDMLTHLVKMIRFCTLFPVVGRGDSILHPVSAQDVARVVATALERDISVGKTYEVVGPEPMMLRDIVRTVADGMSLKVWIIPTPIWVQRVAVRLMNAVFRNPLSTPAQLQMLIDGLPGNPMAVATELGVQTEPFLVGTVAKLQGSIRPLLGFTLRLIRGCGTARATRTAGPRKSIATSGSTAAAQLRRTRVP